MIRNHYDAKLVKDYHNLRNQLSVGKNKNFPERVGKGAIIPATFFVNLCRNIVACMAS